MGLATESRQVVAAVEDTLKDSKITIFSRANWLVRQSYYQGDFGNYDELEVTMLELERQALENGLAFLLAPVYMRLAEISLVRGEDHIALEMNARRRRYLGWIIKPAMVCSIEGRAAVRRGELDLALECAMAAIEDIKRRHFAIIERLYESQLATIHILRGELAAARNIAEDILRQPDGMLTHMTEISALGNLAWVESEQNREDICINLIQTALTKARQAEFTALARMSPLDQWICCKALTHGIETSYVRTVVRNMGLQPEQPDIAEWPWPIRIFTLGRFSLLRNDLPLEHARKAPLKLLTLIKAIVACGGGGVSITNLIDMVWPDEEGDSARQALEVALHRLRKLLGSEAYVVVQDGQVHIDERYCWIDAMAYLRLSDAAEQATKNGRSSECIQLTERAMRLYEGEFLPGENEASWSVLMRDRLRSRFIRQVALVGRHLRDTQRLNDALTVYERGIEIEPLAEEFYQEIMKCQLDFGRKAEGLATYRRLRQTLSVVLGIPPGPASEAIHQQLI